jgi:hypothetical protein
VVADASAVDTALIAWLAADATLAALLPGGVHFGLAPQGVTAFALVTVDETADVAVFAASPAARRAIEVITYAVQAVLPTSALGPATQAAARIDALLEDQPLTIPGYSWLSTVRVERLRPAGEPDAVDKNIRWQHAGGRYRIQVAPTPTVQGKEPRS